MQIDRCRARCRDHQRWNARDLRDTHREEPCHALIEAHMQRDLSALLGLGQGHRQRGRTRSWRHHRIGNAAPDELIDHDQGLRGGRVHIASLSRAAHASVMRWCQ